MLPQILLVDDHPIVRQGIRSLIERELGLMVCREAGGAQSALALIEQTRPDMVVVELSLKHSSGLDLVLAIKERWEDVPILVLSMYDEEVYAERVLRAGASGYVMKQDACTKIITAIGDVLNGSTYVSENVSARLLQKMMKGRVSASWVDTLSNRELQVFQMIGEGLTYPHIADMLVLSVKTIESHVENIKQKLSIRTGRDLLQRATEWVLRSRNRTPYRSGSRGLLPAPSPLRG